MVSQLQRVMPMRAVRAEKFGGYQDLKLVEIPAPPVSEGRVLVRVTAAGVTPLDHTILSGGLPRAKAPLVLGGEGASVVVKGGDPEFPAGTQVMFAGPYGVSENESFPEWLAVRKEHLCPIPDNVDDYLSLSLAGFKPGKTVFAPAIGGSVGNAVTQLARAMGASHAISSTTSHAKAQQARAMGFDEVIDLSVERLRDGVRRISNGYGADIIIDAIGGEVLGEALGTLAMSGNLTTLGYAAGRKSTIDVTDLIWKRGSITSFSLFAQPPDTWTAAWNVVVPLLRSGVVKPIVARTFPLEHAAEALRFLIEERPFGRVVITL